MVISTENSTAHAFKPCPAAVVPTQILSKHATLASVRSLSGGERNAGRMQNIGLKAVVILRALRRHSRRPANWTLSIAIFSTLVTIGLVALYLAQETTEFP
jgi:hypothetical protein